MVLKSRAQVHGQEDSVTQLIVTYQNNKQNRLAIKQNTD